MRHSRILDQCLKKIRVDLSHNMTTRCVIYRYLYSAKSQN